MAAIRWIIDLAKFIACAVGIGLLSALALFVAMFAWAVLSRFLPT